MNLLPTQSGARPRLACELSGAAVVCARSEASTAPVSSAARADLAEGAIVPGLKPGNVVDRVAVIAAIRRAMEGVGQRPGRGNPFLTLVIPDAAVRVLLLDFDALSGKLSEALPLVRFRLKKLVPFEVEDAMVSYQVMTQTRSLTRVLAVAIPRDVLNEYESCAREAGFEPGAVLPSTLAAVAGLEGAPNSAAGEATDAALVVNASTMGVTTAIVKGGTLLLHRSVDLVEHQTASVVVEPAVQAPPTLPAELFEGAERLTFVDHEATAAEWAAQEPVPEHGRDPYGVYSEARVYSEAQDDEAAVQTAEAHGGITGLTAPAVFQPGLASAHRAFDDESEPPVHLLAPDVLGEELARAVSVAVAYFEDTLAVAPRTVLSAGSFGAERLGRVLQTQGVADAEGLRVRELVDPAMLGVSSGVARGALAGVVGALKG